MRNSRGVKFGVGDKVKFQYKIDNKVDTGIVKYIDGSYIGIEFEINGAKYICERYPEEILELLPTE